MTVKDFITELFCRVDDALPNREKYAQAKMHVSEIVTLALLLNLKGCGNRAFYRWLNANHRDRVRSEKVAKEKSEK